MFSGRTGILPHYSAPLLLFNMPRYACLIFGPQFAFRTSPYYSAFSPILFIYSFLVSSRWLVHYQCSAAFLHLPIPYISSLLSSSHFVDFLDLYPCFAATCPIICANSYFGLFIPYIAHCHSSLLWVKITSPLNSSYPIFGNPNPSIVLLSIPPSSVFLGSRLLSFFLSVIFDF